jgi:Domain of unknown function (DUF4175)
MYNSNYYKEILSKLEKLNKREFVFFASIGIQISIFIGAAVFIIFCLLEMAAHFSSSVRTFLFFIFLVSFIGSFLNFFLLPVLKYFNIVGKANHQKTAERVGRNFPSIKDDLLNAMQLVSVNNSTYKYSDKLINAAFLQVYEKTKQIKFESIISFKKAKDYLLYFICFLIFCTALILFVPGLQSASGRLINFNQGFIPPQKFVFHVEPGNSQVTKGEDLTISVSITGEKPIEIYLDIKDTEQTDFEPILLKPDSFGNFKYQIKAVRNSFKYFASAEDIKSEEYLIDVIDRPIIKTLDVTVNSPSYSGIPKVNQIDNGNVSALIGSKVEIKLSSTKRLKNVELFFSDSTKSNLNIGDQNAEGSFKISKDKNYQILLTDINGNKNSLPINYTIKALFDSYPSIEIINPNKDVDLSNDNRLPLFAKISDDYGFTKLVLNYRLTSSKYRQPQKGFSAMEIPFDKNQKESDINYIWNLTPLNLTAEDVVTYYLEIFDNDFVSGPKSAKSAEFAVRVPSLDEILAKADNTHAEAQENLKETLKEAEDLKKTLEKIDQDLKQNKKEISWEEKEKIEKSLDRFEKIQSKIEDTKKQLAQMQQDLQSNNLLSKETLEKYMELQKLMDEFSSDEMKKAMERMQNMLQSLDRKQVQEAMKNLEFNEDVFKKSIERTINLLKRLQIEQKIDELVKRTDDLSNKQEDINKQTNENNLSNKQEKDHLSNKQNEVSNDLDKFDKEMENLSEMMKSLEDMPKEQLEKLKEEFKKQKNQQLSQEASKNIQLGQKMPAEQHQSQLSKNMQEMNKEMQQLQQSINQKNLMQTFTDMMKVMDNMVTLSKQQEELKNETQQSDQISSNSVNEKTQKQDEIQENLDKITQMMSDISQKTFAVSPEMGKEMGDAKREMERAMQAMQNRNTNLAALSQGNAMESINKAATMMKSSIESMMKGNGQSGGGMMSLMQQLNQMSMQQMNLNNLTQMLQQNRHGELTSQQQAQLQRLAQQQELIRKSVEQLNKEAKESGEASKIPADLEHVAQQMHEVISGMNTEKLDDNLIQKQERILSKLLDAQRSINERDYEKNRESNTGKEIARKSPQDLNLSSDQGKNQIKDELNRAVQEGYTKDYEELIRNYYEALQKENVNDN